MANFIWGIADDVLCILYVRVKYCPVTLPMTALNGEGDAVDNLVGEPEHSTLANNMFPTLAFDFILSNPPYGKSCKSDLNAATNCNIRN